MTLLQNKLSADVIDLRCVHTESGALTCCDQSPYKTRKDIKTDTEGRQPAEDGDRDQQYTAMWGGGGVSRATGRWEHLPSEAQETAWLAYTLISDLQPPEL